MLHWFERLHPFLEIRFSYLVKKSVIKTIVLSKNTPNYALKILVSSWYKIWQHTDFHYLIEFYLHTTTKKKIHDRGVRNNYPYKLFNDWKLYHSFMLFSTFYIVPVSTHMCICVFIIQWILHMREISVPFLYEIVTSYNIVHPKSINFLSTFVIIFSFEADIIHMYMYSYMLM